MQRTEVITGEQKRRRYTSEEKARFVALAMQPGYTVSLVAIQTDNGSCYIADATRTFAASLGFIVCTTPVRSPESNGMAESFVKTFKRDYVYVNDLPDAVTVMEKLAEWMEDYNDWHPHKGLKMQSPREYRSSLLAIN